MEKTQLLNPLIYSEYSRWICIWAFSSVCVCNVYFMLAELSEVPDQLRHFCGTFRRVSGIVLYYSFFSWVEAVMSLMSLMSPILGLSGAVPRFSSFSLFIAYIVLVAHNIVELQSERERVENESVDKHYPKKVILEIHYCNHQYPLRINSRNIVFVPGELSRTSRNMYVFAPYQLHNTFPALSESVHRRFVEHTRTDSKIQGL